MTSNVDSTDNRNESNEKKMFGDASRLTSPEEDLDDRQVPKHDDEQTVVQLPLLTTDETSRRNLSFSSTSSKTSDSPDICRICHCEGTNDEPLISPCLCLGTMQYLHQACLQRWIKSAGVKSCELCKFEFIMHSEIKPFKQVFVSLRRENENEFWRFFSGKSWTWTSWRGAKWCVPSRSIWSRWLSFFGLFTFWSIKRATKSKGANYVRERLASSIDFLRFGFRLALLDEISCCGDRRDGWFGKTTFRFAQHIVISLRFRRCFCMFNVKCIFK